MIKPRPRYRYPGQRLRIPLRMLAMLGVPRCRYHRPWRLYETALQITTMLAVFILSSIFALIAYVWR